MKPRIKALSLLLALTLLAACANVGPKDAPEHGWISEMDLDSENRCWDACTRIKDEILPEGAILYDGGNFAEPVDGPVMNGQVDLTGYTVLSEEEPGLHFRLGTADAGQIWDNNNCYIDYLFTDNGEMVAYKFSWKDGYAPSEAVSADEIRAAQRYAIALDGVELTLPEGAEAPEQTRLDDTTEQVEFSYDGDVYCFRVKKTAELENISGLYTADWRGEPPEGAESPKNVPTCIIREGREGVYLWYDHGYSFSVAMSAHATGDKLDIMRQMLLEGMTFPA